MNPPVFLDSAGSALPAPGVLDAVVGHLRREAEVGGYRAAAERADDLAAVRTSIERLLRADVGTVALTDSATRAWSTFVSSIRWRPGDRVLITGAEYASNAILLLRAARVDGVRVEAVPSDPDGRVDLAALAAMLDERVRLVSLVHVPTHRGFVNAVGPVVQLAHDSGALVLLDACQSAGQLDLDVGALGVDALSATGRKWLRGPRGTGLLYVRPGLVTELEPATPDLHAATWTAPDSYELAPDARRFELWEADLAARLGLGVAVDHLLSLGPAAVEAGVADRATRLRAALAGLDGVAVHESGGPLSGIVTFSVAGREPADVQLALRRAEVTVSITHASSALLGMAELGLTSTVRASPHHDVTDDELDRAVAVVADLR